MLGDATTTCPAQVKLPFWETDEPRRYLREQMSMQSSDLVGPPSGPLT